MGKTSKSEPLLLRFAKHPEFDGFSSVGPSAFDAHISRVLGFDHAGNFIQPYAQNGSLCKWNFTIELSRVDEAIDDRDVYVSNFTFVPHDARYGARFSARLSNKLFLQ
jgi:hypothetical protein